MILVLIILNFVTDSLAFECVVEKIIDGDTFICSGQKVRLTGVDTPESVYNQRVERQRSLGDKETVIKLGKEAKVSTSKLLPIGTEIRLEFDLQKTDRYG